MNIALITAGGVGNRMGQDIPKQFMTIENCPVIIYTLQSFQKSPEIDAIAVICLKGWEVILQSYANQYMITKLKWIFEGGKTNQESIFVTFPSTNSMIASLHGSPVTAAPYF